MRFLKIILISVGSVLGVLGAGLGIFYLAGHFNQEPVYPEAIVFEYGEYETDKDFEMLITTPTENVNQNKVTLSFEGVDSSEPIITDGIISVPRIVKIGEPFTVTVEKSIQELDGEYIEWIKGGISKLIAKSENIYARTAETKVFVDVPVHKIQIETSVSSDFNTLSNVFNIGSSFFARAKFIPQASMYKYSRDTEYGGEPEYKDVFFTSQSNDLELVEVENLDRYTKKYNALARSENVDITAQVFKTAYEQEQAYLAVENFEENIAYNNLLNILQNKIETEDAKQKTSILEFKQLVVGGFTADVTQNVPSKYNQYTTIYINKQNLNSNEYSLNANVIATDGLTLLPDEAENFGLAVLLETGTGFKNANLYPAADAEVAINCLNVIEKEINGSQVFVYLPNKNPVDILHSSWQIAPLKENLNLKLALVLLDENQEILGYSFDNNNYKYVFDVESAQISSSLTYWTDILTEEKTLYIYDSEEESDRQIEEYNLVQNHTVYIPLTNTYKQIKYFAYYQKENGDIDNTFDLSEYIITTGYSFETTISSGVNAKLYELPNGVLTPKYNKSGDFEGEIKVLYATVKTSFDNSILKDNNGDYLIDRFSSNSAIGTPQVMTFTIQRTLSKVEAKVNFGSETAYCDTINEVFAVKINTLNAFDLTFKVPAGQKSIFVREFNSGKISVDFYVNGVLDNSMFSVENKTFTIEDEVYSLSYSVGEFSYITGDSGFRTIEVKINYNRGNENDVVTQVTEFTQTENIEDTSNYVFQIYDGKIIQLSFTEEQSLDSVTEQNAIMVTTALEKAQNNGEDVVKKDQLKSLGIYLAGVGSTYSLTFGGENVADLLFDENRIIIVKAFDKYGAEITDMTNWELVSSNPDVIAVDNVSKTISFISSSQTPVSLIVRTTAGNGQGNQVVSSNPLWFIVQTQGKVVKISTEDEVIYNNLDTKVEDENLFTLKNADDNFAETTIELEILGKASEKYILQKGENAFTENYLDILYALHYDQDTYEVFDLRNIVKWTRADATDFGDFIQFDYVEDDPTKGISSFILNKHFGQTGYLNFNVTSELGINFLIKFVINPFIDASISGSYGHESEGASSAIIDGKTYVGVFAQHQVTVTMPINFAEVVTNLSYYAVLYLVDQGTSQIIYVDARKIENFGTGTQIQLLLTFPDVIGERKFQAVIVLDSREAVNTLNYSKLAYDYSKTLYFNVNANIKSTLNTQENIAVSQTTIFENILNTAGAVDYAVSVERKLGEANISYASNSLPYVYARITNNNGAVVNNQYFVIEGNKLVIRAGQVLNGAQEVYLSVFFGNGMPTADMLLDTYHFTISPELTQQENTVENAGFVIYDGITYLQLLAGKTFTFDEIASCFKSGTANITASFEETYVNQQSYWKIVSPTIELYQASNLIYDKLAVTLTIQDVGVVTYPVLITPKLAPLVEYDETLSNNVEANNDLYINQTLEELVTKDIYDMVTDGQTISVFKDVASSTGVVRTTGINKLNNENYSFYLLDGQGETYKGTFARLDSEGNLIIDNVGENEYIIVVSLYNNFKIYYRLQIVSSLQLEVYYPFIDNLDDDENLNLNRAEYVLFKATDVSKIINLTSEFDPSVPANNEFVTINGEEYYTTNRFQLFKYKIGEGGNDKARIQKLAIRGLTLSIKSIKLGNFGEVLTQIDKTYWSQYAVITNDLGSIEVFNLGNFVIEVLATTAENASQVYTIVVERSVKTYSLVVKEGDEDITSMKELPNQAFEMQSPDQNSQEEYSLSNIYLKLVSGTLTTDKTDEMGYSIVGGEGIISVDSVNKKIMAEYTANDVTAQIVFWNRYGEIARRDIVVKSNTKVVAKNAGSEADALTQLTLYSGKVYNLADLIDIYDNCVKKQDITYTNFEFDHDEVYLINNFNQSNQPEFVVLPLNEDQSATFNLSATATWSGGAVEYNFALTILIESGFESNASNSATPVIGESVVALQEKSIDIFNELFTVQNVPNIIYKDEIFSAELQDCKYNFAFEFQAGANNIDKTITFDSNVLKLKTCAVDSDMTIFVKFTLSLEKDTHIFAIVSYYQFVITPDSDVQINYPSPNGQLQTIEKIHVSDEFNLDSLALFSEIERVKVIAKAEGSLKVEVDYEIVHGEIIISGGKAEGKNNLNTAYTFAFENESTVAQIDFNIYVSDLHRATYSLEVYKDYNSLYAIEINTLNEKEGQNEVFYIAEGRTDIFNGPQALKFNVTSSNAILSTGANIEFFNDTIPVGSFSLDSTDAGTTKIVRIEQTEGLEGLTLDTIRFKLNGGEEYLTLDQLSQNETAYFTIDGSGKVNFELFKRIKVYYIGIDVTENNDFIKDKIKLIYNEEGASVTTPEMFKVTYEGLGIQKDEDGNIIGSVTERERQLFVVYNNQENNLGSYYFKVKSNVIVENADKTLEITAGQTVSNLFGVFGVVDSNGKYIVNYPDGSTVPNIPEVMKQGKLKFELSLDKLSKESSYQYLDTRQTYTVTSIVEPLTLASKLVSFTIDDNKVNVIADYEAVAYGAPNQGLYASFCLKWVYALSEDEEDKFEFMTHIDVNILPNTVILLKNKDGTENSALNPQVINDYENDNNKIVLVDKNDYENSLVYAYKNNVSGSTNFAYDLTFKLQDGVNSDLASLLLESSTKTIVVKQPSFATRDFTVIIQDEFGFNSTYYVTANPAQLITYVSISGLNQFFEGDSFALKTSNDETGADHEIRLSKDKSYNNIDISVKLFDTNKNDLNAVSNSNYVGAAQILTINYLDSSIYSSTTHSIAVYFEITLRKGNELYIISTDTFYLQQRYVSTVTDNTARDGVEFKLTNKISFTDRKIGSVIGEPKLADDVALVIKNGLDIQNLVLGTKIKSTSGAISSTVNIDASNTTNARYYLMSQQFQDTITDVNAYTYLVTNVNFNDVNNTNIALVGTTQIKITCYDSNGLVITFDENTMPYYDVLLTDGVQYVLVSNVPASNEAVNIQENSSYQKFTATYGNWSICGYASHSDSLPVYNILKDTNSNKTYLVIDNNLADFEITLKNIGDYGTVEQKELIVKKQDTSYSINGLSVDDGNILTESNTTKILLSNTSDTNAECDDENWIISNVDYSFKNLLEFTNDKRLDIVTVEKYQTINNESPVKLEVVTAESSTVTQTKFDGGKFKFTIADGVKINQLFIKATSKTNADLVVDIYPQDFNKETSNMYSFVLANFGVDSTNWEYTIHNQKATGLTLENNYRVYNSNMNLTSDFTTNTQDYLLDVTQGLWTNIYDKANVESIDINFNGDNKKLTVYLTHDGLQTFSMLEKGLYSPSLTLKNTPLNNDDIKKVKDLIFYDDTIKFELEEGLVGEVAVEIVRVRKGITTTRNISISIKSYAYAYYFGITSLFGELPQEGDKYTLICNSIPASYGKTIKIDTPYSAQATVTAVKGQVLVEFVVDSLNTSEIADSKTTLNIGSLGEYNNVGSTDKKVQINQYYIACYRGAYYDLNALFNVSPHYFAVNLDRVNTRYNDSTVVISDYTQTLDADGNVVYTIDYANWTKNIYFEDINGNFVNDTLYAKGKTVGDTARIVKFSIVDAEYGSADFNDEFNIVTNGVADISNSHITMRLYVALNGQNSVVDGTDTQTDWLDIGTLTLLFNANYQYSIIPNTSMVLSNSSVSGEDDTYTFRFANYDSSATEDLSFSAVNLFENKTVNISDIKTMVGGTSKYYYLPTLVDNNTNKYYQLSYQLDSTTNVVTTIEATNILENERFVMYYGVKFGSSITIKAKKAQNDDDYIVATWENKQENKVGYGTCLLSSLTWKNQDGVDASYSADYTYFEYPDSASRCFVPLSYINMDDFKNISYYDGTGTRNNDSYIGDKLITNDNFHYSNLFELVSIEENTLSKVKVDVSANSTKHFSVTEISNTGTSYNGLTWISKLQNPENVNQLKEITLKQSANKYVVLSDISTKVDGEDSYNLENITALLVDDGIYQITFGKYEGSYSETGNVRLFFNQNMLQGSELKTMKIKDYLYNQEVINLNVCINLTWVTQASLDTVSGDEYYSIIRSEYSGESQSYIYDYEITQSSPTFDFKADKEVVYTTVKSALADENKLLAWHEYIDENLPNQKLYYKLNETTASSDSNNIYAPVGSKISEIWLGTFKTDISTSSRYVLKLSQSDKGILFNPIQDYYDQGILNIYKILQDANVAEVPSLSNITLAEFNPTTFWSELSLTENNYYNVMQDGNKKAIVYYTKDYSINLLTILATNLINLNNIEIVSVGAEYALELETGVYMLSNGLVQKIVEITEEDKSVSLAEFLINGYISRNINYKQLKQTIPFDASAFTDSTVNITVSLDGKQIKTFTDVAKTDTSVSLAFDDIALIAGTEDLELKYTVTISGTTEDKQESTQVSIWQDDNVFQSLLTF